MLLIVSHLLLSKSFNSFNYFPKNLRTFKKNIDLIGKIPNTSYKLFSNPPVKTFDVNLLPDSKKKLSVISKKVSDNLAPGVLNIKMLKEVVKDLELESSQSVHDIFL